jgi:hypothetical protein
MTERLVLFDKQSHLTTALVISYLLILLTKTNHLSTSGTLHLDYRTFADTSLEEQAITNTAPILRRTINKHAEIALRVILCHRVLDRFG